MRTNEIVSELSHAEQADLLLAREILLNNADDEPIEHALYNRWYHRTIGESRNFPLPSAYEATLSSVASYQPGWRVVNPAVGGLAGAVLVKKDGESRYLAPPSVVPLQKTALRFNQGDEVLVRLISSEYVNGFWNVFSPKWLIDGMPEQRQRLYFSVKTGQERQFVGVFCTLASMTENWSMKILAGNNDAGRNDVAVAYLPKSLSLKEPWLQNLISLVAHFVDGAGPALTSPLLPGISWAPEFADDKSFGQVLCDTLITASKKSQALDSEATWLDVSARMLDELFEE